VLDKVLDTEITREAAVAFYEKHMNRETLIMWMLGWGRL
jgi:hypothetical protein